MATALFRFRKRQSRPQEETRDCCLRLYANDVAAHARLSDKDGTCLHAFSQNKAVNDGETRSPLALAVARLTPEWESRIGEVQVFVDDSDIAIIDSRQAKLTHFEGRGLAEFGKYQLGGRPAAFGSHPYGQTGTHETEKRLVGYISEDRLTTIFFALGKLAKYATFCGPWTLQKLLRDPAEEPRALLSVHGNFSCLIFANPAAGAVALRHLPIGANSFAQAYGAEHGLTQDQAAEALMSRKRLQTGGWPPDAKSPLAHTPTYAALSPLLNQLAGEVRATGEYFEFQRLAGRTSTLGLNFAAGAIQGFMSWLTDMLDIGVEAVPEGDLPGEPALNFLTGMRSGLLKLGNQLYDFENGRFVPSAGDKSRKASPGEKGDLLAGLKRFSAQPLSLQSFRPIAMPLAATVMVLAAGWGANEFWLAPIDDALTTSASLYQAALRQTALPAPDSTKTAVEPVLWSRDLLALAGAMPYDMKLTHVAFTAAKPGSPPLLDITGHLPKNGRDNLQLIGHYIARVSGDSALKRRFKQIDFAGAGAEDKPDDPQMQFHITAKVAP